MVEEQKKALDGLLTAGVSNQVCRIPFFNILFLVAEIFDAESVTDCSAGRARRATRP